MILTLTASIMFWSLQQPEDANRVAPEDGESQTDLADEVSNLAIDASEETS